MSELEERLNAVLSNPEEMSRIAAMAQKLMGELPSESAAAPSAPEAAGGGLLGQSRREPAGGFWSRLTSGQSGNGKKQLADALAPYLSAERRAVSPGRCALRARRASRGRPFRNGGAAMAYNRYNGSTGERTRVEEPLPPEKAQSGSPLPRESAPERPPPPPENEKTPPSPLLSLRSGLDGIFERLDPKRLETEDLLVLAILWLLYRESGDWELLIALGAYYFDL